MNLITPLLNPANVLADVEASSKKRLFEQAGQLFQASHGVTANEVFESLFSREKLGSTALGYGIAIPHGRIKHLKETACAFIRLKSPIEFDAPDRQPVDLVFGLLVPEGELETRHRVAASLHHTAMARQVTGVKDALCTEQVAADGTRQRYVYVEMEPGVDVAHVAAAIRADPLFLSDETLVFPVDSVAALEQEGRGIVLERRSGPAGSLGRLPQSQARGSVRLDFIPDSHSWIRIGLRVDPAPLKGKSAGVVPMRLPGSQPGFVACAGP